VLHHWSRHWHVAKPSKELVHLSLLSASSSTASWVVYVLVRISHHHQTEATGRDETKHERHQCSKEEGLAAEAVSKVPTNPRHQQGHQEHAKIRNHANLKSINARSWQESFHFPAPASFLEDDIITFKGERPKLVKHKGGFLKLGIEDRNASTIWVSVINSYWSIQLVDLKVGNTSIGLTPDVLNGEVGGVIDSGATLSYFPKAVFFALKDRIGKLCLKGVRLPGVCGAAPGRSIFDGYCFAMTTEQVALFPVLTFFISRSISLDLYPQDYLIEHHLSDFLCLGIGRNDNEDVMVLGDTFVRGFYLFFDMRTNKIGFQEQTDFNCY